MSELNFYTSGKNKQLVLLKESYLRLKKQLQENRDLSDTEKRSRLNALKMQFNKEKKSLINNLY